MKRWVFPPVSILILLTNKSLKWKCLNTLCLIPISIYSKGEQRLPKKSLLIHASYQHITACISLSICFSCSVILHCLQVYMIITWSLHMWEDSTAKRVLWLKKILTALAHLLAWVCSPYFKMFNKLRHSNIKHQPDNKTGQELFNSIPWTTTSAIYSSRKLTVILTKHKHNYDQRQGEIWQKIYFTQLQTLR